MFLEGLPAFPDGISRAPGGCSYWLALVTPTTRRERGSVYSVPDWLRRVANSALLLASAAAAGEMQNLARSLSPPAPRPTLPAPSAALVQRLPSSRLLRWLVAWMPEALKPKALHYGWVAEVSWQPCCGSASAEVRVHDAICAEQPLVQA